ncbi:MAG: DnaJ domain-containing protein [Pseudanabaenales cyanobacterium]|nr:DnaJ domain-containing protein [Pseudanabaenales cyanobacterium]
MLEAASLMSQMSFSPDWIKKFSDPYAVLGVSVTADESRILKRYRQVAKLLHPDVQTNKDSESHAFVGQVLARLVNPSYQRLKQAKGRAETLATLRFRVRRLSRENKLTPDSELANQLLAIAEPEVEMFYEQMIATLATHQYEAANSFEQITQQIGELNLVYLRRKMGDLVIRQKRTGLVAAQDISQVSIPPVDVELNQSTVNYAERHAIRAREYLQKGNHALAIQEMRDALKIQPSNSDYHSLLGQAYWLQRLPGMAKVHFRQALKLDSKHPVALKYAQQLNIDLKASNRNQSSKKRRRDWLLSFFVKKH